MAYSTKDLKIVGNFFAVGHEYHLEILPVILNYRMKSIEGWIIIYTIMEEHLMRTFTDILWEPFVKFIQMVPREYRVNVLITFIMEHHLHHYEPHPCNILHFQDYNHGL